MIFWLPVLENKFVVGKKVAYEKTGVSASVFDCGFSVLIVVEPFRRLDYLFSYECRAEDADTGPDVGGSQYGGFHD